MPAKMFPDPLPADVLSDPLRKAEIEVYTLLRRQLSSRYTVFYSRPWIGTNHDGTESEGEADFVIASPETGFLVVEVKGGGVGRDAVTGEWFSIDRYNRRHKIKDPVKQALRSKNELRPKLSRFPGIAGKWIGMGTAVILPDCTGSAALVGVDTPLDHFALCEDMPKIGAWIVNRLDQTIGDRGGALGAAGMFALEQLLAKSFQLRVPLTRTVDSDHDQVVYATEQQYALLEYLHEHKRAAIGGAAGSGKTILALHKALELAREVAPERVLLTCYNAALAGWLRDAAEDCENLEVGTFHQMCYRFAQDNGVALRGDSDSLGYFETILPDAMLQAISGNSDNAFAGIIVDEGQDFSDRWLDALQLALKSEDSAFWIFYDDNQKLYGRSDSLLKAMVQPPFVLRKNVRNPKPVFERLSPLLDGAPVISCGPAGRPVEEIVVSRGTSLDSKLCELIRRLVEDEQIDPEDIAVLVKQKEDMDAICLNRQFDRILTCNAEERVRGRVCLDTVRRFKGLERKVVVLVEPAAMAKSGDILYVGLSRPTGHLILLGTKKLTLDNT